MSCCNSNWYRDILSCQDCCYLSLAWILFLIPLHFLAWCWNLSCLHGSGISRSKIPWELREILFVHHLHLPPLHSSNNFFLMSNPFSSDFSQANPPASSNGFSFIRISQLSFFFFSPRFFFLVESVQGTVLHYQCSLHSSCSDVPCDLSYLHFNGKGFFFPVQQSNSSFLQSSFGSTESFVLWQFGIFFTPFNPNLH